VLRVAAELVTALTGTAPPTSRSRFHLISHLVGLRAGQPRLVVVDEAQRLDGECIEPMLRSRIFRRLPVRPCHGAPRSAP
jgi:hypothetical protein